MREAVKCAGSSRGVTRRVRFVNQEGSNFINHTEYHSHPTRQSHCETRSNCTCKIISKPFIKEILSSTHALIRVFQHGMYRCEPASLPRRFLGSEGVVNEITCVGQFTLMQFGGSQMREIGNPEIRHMGGDHHRCGSRTKVRSCRGSSHFRLEVWRRVRGCILGD